MVKVEVAGRSNDYHVRTLLTWLEELKGFLEGELGEEVEILFREEDSEHPLLYVNGRLAFEGLPGEEGYLVEVILSNAKR